MDQIKEVLRFGQHRISPKSARNRSFPTGATGLLGVGCANPDISAEMTQASRPSRRDESLGELNDRCQGAWNRCCASSRPTSTRDSTASAAAPRVKGSSARSVAEKLLSTKSAGSIRPGGRPIPTRTLR